MYINNKEKKDMKYKHIIFNTDKHIFFINSEKLLELLVEHSKHAVQNLLPFRTYVVFFLVQIYYPTGWVI